MKLFEFEHLEEGIARVLNLKGIAVLINDHANDQAAARGIDPNILMSVIKRIPDVRNKFKPYDDNQKFTIWSKSTNTGIGLRRRADKDGYMRVEVMTAINKLFDNPDPVLTVG